MDPRRRPTIVTLTLIGLPLGAIGLANAFPQQEMRRNLYPDRAACERDYSAAQCAQGGGSGGVGFWHGPYYNASRTAAGAARDPGPGRTCQITPTAGSTRCRFDQLLRAG